MRARLLATLAAAFALLAVANAVGGATRTYETALAIEESSLLADGAIDVTGTLRAKGPFCGASRQVALVDRRPTGPPRELAFGFAGSPSGVWRIRTEPAVTVEGTLFVKAGRREVLTVSVSRNGAQHERRVICKPARLRVALP